MSMNAQQKIEWLDSLTDGIEQAKRTGKIVLLDFFNPG
jgi:hypothetical protein